MSYIVHVDCCGLSTIVIKKIIIIIIIIINNHKKNNNRNNVGSARGPVFGYKMVKLLANNFSVNFCPSLYVCIAYI